MPDYLLTNLYLMHLNLIHALKFYHDQSQPTFHMSKSVFFAFTICLTFNAFAAEPNWIWSKTGDAGPNASFRKTITLDEPGKAVLIAAGDNLKGDVLAAARLAGIQGAKKTSELIPLCHPLLIGKVDISFSHRGAGQGKVALRVIAAVKGEGQTGLEMEAMVAASTAAERGDYLATLAGCGGCHTPAPDGSPLPGLGFGGGTLFQVPDQPDKPVFSANITFDPSGIAHYDEGRFTETLRTGQIPGRMLNHIMPFLAFRNMTDEDISDIFAFLKTVPPAKHRVSNTDPPTPCPVCNQSHGLGDRNVKQ